MTVQCLRHFAHLVADVRHVKHTFMRKDGFSEAARLQHLSPQAIVTDGSAAAAALRHLLRYRAGRGLPNFEADDERKHL